MTSQNPEDYPARKQFAEEESFVDRPRAGEGTLAVLEPGWDYASVTDKIAEQVLTPKVRPGWVIGLVFCALVLLVFTCAVGYLLMQGVGIWGVNIPVAWGFAIVNFVWWIGIGHAGTFISAFLFLLRQDWRTSINRFAEAMTIFAVMCAGMFPLLHLGRPWVFYWLFPYPNPMLMWPQFRSPLVWDVFAVSTYFTVSLIFWYVGLVPDLATLRDRAKSRVGRVVYGFFALGWTGAARHWARYKVAYLLLAGLAAPLVVSVHSIVGMDFAAAQVPGWHSTIFPPYFVAGAIYSGFAMVLTLAIPLRAVYHLQDFITDKHIENCGKLMLITGLIVGYGYACEGFMSWWSGNPFEQYLAVNRAFGPYAIAYWYGMVAFNFTLPHVLWFKTVRTTVPVMFAISILVNFGMWMERFVIVVGSLHRDFMPSMWSMFYPTIWDWAILAGTLAFFTFCFLLFMKFLPVISISEMRELVHVQQEELEGRGHPHHKPGVSGKLPEELPPGLEGAT